MNIEINIPVTVIIPIFNERNLIKNAVYSVLNSSYQNMYIILVNDGSTDTSLDFLINEFKLKEVPMIIDEKIKTQKINTIYVSKTHINMTVIDKENGGASDALNAGINACFTPYFYTMDADSVMVSFSTLMGPLRQQLKGPPH